jgi:hypothetical protein
VAAFLEKLLGHRYTFASGGGSEMIDYVITEPVPPQQAEEMFFDILRHLRYEVVSEGDTVRISKARASS